MPPLMMNALRSAYLEEERKKKGLKVVPAPSEEAGAGAIQQPLAAAPPETMTGIVKRAGASPEPGFQLNDPIGAEVDGEAKPNHWRYGANPFNPGNWADIRQRKIAEGMLVRKHPEAIAGVGRQNLNPLVRYALSLEEKADEERRVDLNMRRARSWGIDLSRYDHERADAWLRSKKLDMSILGDPLPPPPPEIVTQQGRQFYRNSKTGTMTPLPAQPVGPSDQQFIQKDADGNRWVRGPQGWKLHPEDEARIKGDAADKKQAARAAEKEKKDLGSWATKNRKFLADSEAYWAHVRKDVDAMYQDLEQNEGELTAGETMTLKQRIRDYLAGSTPYKKPVQPVFDAEEGLEEPTPLPVAATPRNRVDRVDMEVSRPRAEEPSVDDGEPVEVSQEDHDLLADAPQTGPVSDYVAWMVGKVRSGVPLQRVVAALGLVMHPDDMKVIIEAANRKLGQPAGTP